MPTYEREPEFMRDLERLTPAVRNRGRAISRDWLHFHVLPLATATMAFVNAEGTVMPLSRILEWMFDTPHRLKP